MFKIGTNLRVISAVYSHCRDLTKEIRGLSNVEQVLLDTADSVMDTKRKVEFGVQQIIFKVCGSINGWRAKKWSLGLVNFVPSVAYHFCLSLPEKLSQPRDHFLAKLCTLHAQ